MIKFNKHNVVETESKKKCRVYYSLDNRRDGRKCVTLYAKTCLDKLTPVFGACINNSDSTTDYFETDKVVLFENHPLYTEARKRAESIK